MTKIYVTNGSLGLKVRVGESRKLIVFDETYNGRPAYITDNEDVQKALESNALFENIFRLVKMDSNGNEVVPQKEIVDERPKEYDVMTLQDARNILIEKFKVNNSTIRSKAAVLETAEKLGITFNGL